MLNTQALTGVELAILEGLEAYRFLTAKQLLHLGVTTNISHMYAVLGKLNKRRSPLIGKLSFGVVPARGRLHALYYLTASGAELLVDDNGEIPSFPRKPTAFNRDYDHRIATVDAYIMLSQSLAKAQMIVEFAHYYFDRGNKTNHLQPSTHIATQTGKALVPDLVVKAGFDRQDGANNTDAETSRLFIVEAYLNARTGYTAAKIAEYYPALFNGDIGKAFDYAFAPRVLVFVESQKAISNLLKSLQIPQPLAPLFTFIALDTEACIDAHGTAVELTHALT